MRARSWTLTGAFSLASLCAAGAAEAQTVANIAARGQCDTSGVERLSQQLVDTQMCAMPGVFVPFAPHAGITLTSSHIHAYLLATARTALWQAASHLDLQINSAFRTLADQYVLYYSGACALAATPGNSNHETGRAVDLSNYSAALSAMTNAGCTHTYPSSDPVHYDCPGSDMRAEGIRAFQHLWNLNNPSDMIAEDGAYGPATESRLARAPAGGFAVDGSCDTPMATWGAAYVAQSFPTAASGAIMMRPGEQVAAWIDLRNIGSHAWDDHTFLATTQPRDRASAFAASDWTSPSRVGAPAGAVATGATHRFMFTLQAPATPGTYDEHFGVVEEGTAWFSDTGQGGPPDDQLEARIVVAGDPVDGGVADAGEPDATSDDAASDGATPSDGATARDGAASDAVADARDAGFHRLPDGALVPNEMAPGCACSAPGAPSRGAPSALLAAGALSLLLRRRRRTARR